MVKADNQTLAWLIGLALVGWLIWLLAPVLTPFAAGALLAYFGDPLADRIERVRIGGWQWSRTFATAIVFILLSAVLALLVLVLVPMIARQAQSFGERLPEYVDWAINTALPWVSERLGLGLSLELPDAEELGRLVGQYWQDLAQASIKLLGSISAGGQAIIGWAVNLFLIPVVAFYLLRDWDNIVERVRRQLPRRIEPRVVRLVSEMDAVLASFLRGQLLVMLALGVFWSVGLALVGLDLALLIGIGSAVLAIVPYLGLIIGAIAAAVAALVQFGDILHLALALGVYFGGQVLEQVFLTPKLIGDRVGLHPVAVIFAVLAGGQLFGFLGVLLALPVASVLMVLLRHVNDGYLASTLYLAVRDEPPGGSVEDTEEQRPGAGDDEPR